MRHLDEPTTRRLREEPLTYPRSAGASGPPEGFARLRIAQLVSAGRQTFDAVADALMSWRVHERSGVTVRASAEMAALDEVVLLRTWIGPVRVTAPCRVVDVVDEADRRGFAYGTLRGHPESGEERFVVERTPDGVLVTIDAFSRPSSLLARTSGGLARRLQVRQTRRYVAAAKSFATDGAA